MIDAIGLSIDSTIHNTIFLHRLGQRHAIHTDSRAIDKATFIQFIQNTQDTTSTTALLYRVFLCVRRQFAQARYLATEGIDILHGKVGTCLLSHCQQVQHGIGTTSHGDIKCHCIHKGFAGSDITRQYALVTIFVISKGILHYLTGCCLKQLYTVGMGCQNRTITWKRKADSLCERVHRVGSEHTRARTATWTGTFFYLFHLLVCD